MKIIEDAAAESGGYKTVIAEVNGEKVYSKLKYEAGVHRVQVRAASGLNQQTLRLGICVYVVPRVGLN